MGINPDSYQDALCRRIGAPRLRLIQVGEQLKPTTTRSKDRVAIALSRGDGW
jgi:hypothetical protein